jgi:hypothetical protein
LPGLPGADPINNADLLFLRQRAQAVIRELVAALPASQRGMVETIPLLVDDAVGEVNAFAACTQGGKAVMAISDGLMEIQSQMARAKATDEIFGTAKFDQYVQFIAQSQRPNASIVKPPAGFFDPGQDLDARKIQRQHQLFDEELAFVLGHELAHHYLQHTGCAGPQSGALTPADVGRALSNAVPVFNQPNESASDWFGTQNTLSAGARRQGYRWTEGGAMLTLSFFLALKKISPVEAILFAFEQTHPHPAFRVPTVQQAAAHWRFTGGNPLPPPSFPPFG